MLESLKQRKLIDKAEGSASYVQLIGFVLILLGIDYLLFKMLWPPNWGNDPLTGEDIAITFFVIMLGVSFAFPSLLRDKNDGLSTMRIVVFMMVNVICMLLLKLGWGATSLKQIGVDEYWLGIIAFVFGAKATQSYFDSKLAMHVASVNAAGGGNPAGGGGSNPDPNANPGGNVTPVVNPVATDKFEKLSPDERVNLMKELISAKMKEWLAAYPGLTSVGIGKKHVDGRRTDTDALVFSVKSKDAPAGGNKIPAVIEYKDCKIPTDVIVVGEVKGHAGISCGSDISRTSTSYTGALGAKVYADAKPHLLSCYHVLYPNEFIAHADDGTATGDPSVQSNGSPIARVSQGMFTFLTDSAVAALNEGVQVADLPSKVIYDLQPGDIDTNMKVSIERNGSRQSGFVRQLGNSSVISYLGARTEVMYDLIMTTAFTSAGDSGSVAFDDKGRIVGMVVAGDDNEVSYLIPMRRVLASVGANL